ncbi:aldo/keto reductase [Mycena rosella]|uniref:Aldo/keto reductase n=1 Tax=Mycena rosella TaxID=1033263 RepID=A0AAD7CDN1_MYCRO|nr:aldo/keto reductase [Mycena rosella]
MVQKTTKLGGTASEVSVGRVAHGLMMMTWIPTPVPEEQAFEAIKAGVDALPAGTKMFLSSGDFYAMDMGPGNLEMLSRFYAKYPEYADKTFLSVKGCIRDRAPDNSPESIRKSVENSQRALGTVKKIDLFEPARIDRKVTIEEMMQTLVALVKEGKFSHIGLSECNADTLRKAHALHPVTAVEIEISPFSYEENQKKVIAAAAELGISVLAYSPLGRGFIAGKIKNTSDLQEGDVRLRYSRFKDENMKHNLPIVEALDAMATQKGMTVAQLCIAWVAALGSSVIPLPGSSKSTRTLENLEAGDIALSVEEAKEMHEIIMKLGVKGDRSAGLTDEQMHLWG